MPAPQAPCSPRPGGPSARSPRRTQPAGAHARAPADRRLPVPDTPAWAASRRPALGPSKSGRGAAGRAGVTSTYLSRVPGRGCRHPTRWAERTPGPTVPVPVPGAGQPGRCRLPRTQLCAAGTAPPLAPSRLVTPNLNLRFRTLADEKA